MSVKAVNQNNQRDINNKSVTETMLNQQKKLDEEQPEGDYLNIQKLVQSTQTP